MRKMLYLVGLLSFFLPLNIYSKEKKTVCLNMIVKNESKVIERCLKSLKNHIDYWVIVDTGSTDGTQEIIKKFMKNVPGKLHQSSWVNFEYNRNEALSLAKNKGDYILFIDADEQLIFPDNYKWPSLEKDFYYIVSSYSGTKYNRVQLINSKLDWKWVGVLHEYLDAPNISSSEVLPDVVNLVTPDGCRSQDPEKFLKDAKILEKALLKEPQNSRYVFYLAQSYKDANVLEKAIENYEKRAKMGGFQQEVFWSLYQIGCLQERLNRPPEEFLSSYFKAYVSCPSRLEPLNRIITYYRFAKEYQKAYDIAKLGLDISYPDSNSLFIEDWVYSYNFLLECSIDAYWIGKYEESKVMCEKLLQKHLPENVKECVENNLRWANLMIQDKNMKDLMDLVNSSLKELSKAEQNIKK